MSLEQLGWDSEYEHQFTSHREAGLVPARVAREDRERYLVLHEGGESPAEIAGRMRHEARTRADYPAVGDWVGIRVAGGDGAATIAAVLPRRSVFARKMTEDVTDAQIVAANIDAVFVVMGLDGNFNVRRVERYLAAAWDSGAQPVVVLNKADVVEDIESAVAEVEAAAPGVPVVALSALRGDGVEALGEWLAPGRTIALMGSSGVGKSTLVNALLGEERLATGDVREVDSKGRHTTTHRELVALPGGALMVDTPGMRGLLLWGDESSLSSAFPEVDALAAQCRFRDCGHQSEPGCAVREAEAEGRLDAGRLASWKKLQRELRWLAMKQDARLKSEETAKWKVIHNSMKHHPKLKARGER